MKKATCLSLILCITTPLHAGWLNNPDASDVSASIKEAWQQCNLVKPDNFKKTNGIDRGHAYQIEVSYTLEITRNIAEEDIWDTKVPAYITPDLSKDSDEIRRQDALNAPHWAAKKNIENFFSENCPYPRSDDFQLYASLNHKNGLPLTRGEILHVTTVFVLVQSENGWIIQ
jgi:hypothetical protein